MSCRPCARACCAWRIETSSAIKCGFAPAPPAPTFSGGSRRTRGCEQRLPDGSYLSYVYPSDKDRRQGTNGVKIRVIEYRLEGVADAEPIYRLVTTILDPTMASAEELAALYHERWEIDIDQAWRLSRFCCWGGVSAFDPWRGLPPMRRGRSDRFQGRDRLGIRQDQFGALGAGASAAARQSALLDPGV